MKTKQKNWSTQTVINFQSDENPLLIKVVDYTSYAILWTLWYVESLEKAGVLEAL